MKTLELEEPVILSQLEDMTEDDFVDWYDEDVKAEFITIALVCSWVRF
jgi:hypothetical protein